MWTSQVYGHHDKMARTKTHVTKHRVYKTDKRESPQEATYIKKYLFFVFFGFFWGFFSLNFQCLKGLLQKMLNSRLGTVNEKHWGFKPHHRSMAGGHLLSIINGKVNIWTITSYPSLLQRFREENSLYSQILTVRQLLSWVELSL